MRSADSCPVYIVKRLSKSGIWSAVSLIDSNGSFRGEAKFETRKEAEEYMAAYLKRMKNPQNFTLEGKGTNLKVFDSSMPDDKQLGAKPSKKPAAKPSKKPDFTRDF